MDDMQAGISKILEDPDSMAKIKEMASALFGGEEKPNKAENSAAKLPLGGLEALGDGLDMGALLKIGNALKSGGNDSRSNLLMALKPHLSEGRRDRVDKAVKILRLVSLLPLIKESGIF